MAPIIPQINSLVNQMSSVCCLRVRNMSSHTWYVSIDLTNLFISIPIKENLNKVAVIWNRH